MRLTYRGVRSALGGSALLVLLVVACSDSKNGTTATGQGGTSGGAGASGSWGGAGAGGGAGVGGVAGTGSVPTSCPATRPDLGTRCNWIGSCAYAFSCPCGDCTEGIGCDLGKVVLLGRDSCDPGRGGEGGGGVGGGSGAGGIAGAGGVGGRGGAGRGGVSGRGGRGGVAGAGGISGVGGVGGPSTCPASRPPLGSSCAWMGGCDYKLTCPCGDCFESVGCSAGKAVFLGANGCTSTGTGGQGGWGDGGIPICSPGFERFCNDNLLLSSIHGQCTDGGTTCQCFGDASVLPNGRCQ
jgi:hypothetical protein